jgi:hypothetical protein
MGELPVETLLRILLLVADVGVRGGATTMDMPTFFRCSRPGVRGGKKGEDGV